MPPRSLFLALLGLAPACLTQDIEYTSQGELVLTEGGSEPDSTGGSSDTEGIETSTGGPTSPTSPTAGDASGEATGTPNNCDDDPACGPEETVASCPEQCSECGDGVVSGDERCDNGVNDSPAHTYFKPSASACLPDCRLPAWCGDGLVNGPEPCDSDKQQTSTCEVDCTVPVCGDGIHNPLHAEACDDHNTHDFDGCSADCSTVERRVFVTSRRYRAHFEPTDDNPIDLVGLALADLRCNQLAAAADLTGTYKAWLSDNSTTPATRFDTEFTGNYRLTDKGASLLAVGWPDLVDGTLLHRIDIDQRGDMISGSLVWTNTLADGTAASTTNCYDWTSVLASVTTSLGDPSELDARWSLLLTDQTCAGEFHLYCIEDR